jgi:hypothetical protein
VEEVRDRLERAAKALERAGIPYAVVGGNGVAAWVATADESAVRNTRDVDILLDRANLDAAKEALAAQGFFYRHVSGMDLFLDGPEAKARDAVHIVFAGEKVREDYAEAAPRTTEAESSPRGCKVLRLPALVRMNLTSFGDKDRMHLRDLIEVGLVGRRQCADLPPPLAERLAWLLDHPEE